MTDPRSLTAADVTEWLGGDPVIAQYVRAACEAELTRKPYFLYAQRYEGDDDSPAGRRARRIMQSLLFETVFLRGSRPAEVGALRWWTSAWPVHRMIRDLVDLWFRDREQLHAALTRSQNAYTVRLDEGSPAHSPPPWLRRTLAQSSPGVPEPARECTLSDVCETRPALSGDLR